MMDRQHESGEGRDAYERVTGKIIADLEQGARTWLRPWNAEHAAGRITRRMQEPSAYFRQN